MTDRWQRPRSPWREDAGFCAAAPALWPEDWALANRAGYDRGAVQRLRQRWQGWCARDLAELARRADG